MGNTKTPLPMTGPEFEASQMPTVGGHAGGHAGDYLDPDYDICYTCALPDPNCDGYDPGCAWAASRDERRKGAPKGGTRSLSAPAGFLTLEEVAARIKGCTTEFLRRKLREGQLIGYRQGRWFIREKDVAWARALHRDRYKRGL